MINSVEIKKALMSANPSDWPEEISPDELWHMWGWLPYLPHEEGTRITNWLIASPGEAGLADIVSPRGHDQIDVLAAFSLTDLRRMVSILTSPTKASSSLLSRVVSSISGNEIAIVCSSDGTTRFQLSSDPLKTGETVVHRGRLKDLLNLVKEGDRIIAEKDYFRIHASVREISEDHPAMWLLGQRSLDSYSAYLELMAMPDNPDED